MFAPAAIGIHCPKLVTAALVRQKEHFLTIIKEYTEGRLPLYHFDVYRIGDPGEMDALGYEEYFYGDGVCLIEWSKLIEELIPGDAVQVNISRDFHKGPDYREIEILGTIPADIGRGNSV